MVDLTERLAERLKADDFGPPLASSIAHWAADILPLLLSEPELVAGLAEEVRLSVLTERERAVMKLGKATATLYNQHPVWDDPESASQVFDAALEAVRALTPEAP